MQKRCLCRCKRVGKCNASLCAQYGYLVSGSKSDPETETLTSLTTLLTTLTKTTAATASSPSREHYQSSRHLPPL